VGIVRLDDEVSNQGSIGVCGIDAKGALVDMVETQGSVVVCAGVVEDGVLEEMFEGEGRLVG